MWVYKQNNVTKQPNISNNISKSITSGASGTRFEKSSIRAASGWHQLARFEQLISKTVYRGFSF